MGDISDIHKRIYDYIVESLDEQGYPPSVREICSRLGIKSTSTVHKYLNDLENGGYIHRENAKNRSIRIMGRDSKPAASNAVMVPMLGSVAAGMPILAVQESGEYVLFEGGRYSKNELFALKVRGESMIEVGIFDGDYIIARKCQTAENGQIIVALIEDEATVKTFYKEAGHYRLQPENSSMEPIIVDEMAVLGRVIAVIRYLE